MVRVLEGEISKKFWEFWVLQSGYSRNILHRFQRKGPVPMALGISTLYTHKVKLFLEPGVSLSHGWPFSTVSCFRLAWDRDSLRKKKKKKIKSNINWVQFLSWGFTEELRKSEACSRITTIKDVYSSEDGSRRAEWIFIGFGNTVFRLILSLDTSYRLSRTRAEQVLSACNLSTSMLRLAVGYSVQPEPSQVRKWAVDRRDVICLEMHQESKVKEPINFLIHLREKDFFSGSTFFSLKILRENNFFGDKRGAMLMAMGLKMG